MNTSVQEEYAHCKVKLDELKKKIEEECGLPKGTLVKYKESHYRVKFSMVGDLGDIKIYLDPIKNKKINWNSSSDPVVSDKSELEVVSWKFDEDKFNDLYDAAGETDSISQKEEHINQLSELVLNCKHDWKINYRLDVYECDHCGFSTKSEKRSDWLNNEQEDHNINLEPLEEL